MCVEIKRVVEKGKGALPTDASYSSASLEMGVGGVLSWELRAWVMLSGPGQRRHYGRVVWQVDVVA